MARCRARSALDTPNVYIHFCACERRGREDEQFQDQSSTTRPADDRLCVQTNQIAPRCHSAGARFHGQALTGPCAAVRCKTPPRDFAPAAGAARHPASTQSCHNFSYILLYRRPAWPPLSPPARFTVTRRPRGSKGKRRRRSDGNPARHLQGVAAVMPPPIAGGT